MKKLKIGNTEYTVTQVQSGFVHVTSDSGQNALIDLADSVLMTFTELSDTEIADARQSLFRTSDA